MIRLGLLMLLAAPAALAQTPTPPSDPAAPAAVVPPAPASPVTKTASKSPGDRIICEDEEIIGSRLQGRRICKSASQWAAERQAARDEVQRAQTNRNCTGVGGC